MKEDKNKMLEEMMNNSEALTDEEISTVIGGSAGTQHYDPIGTFEKKCPVCGRKTVLNILFETSCSRLYECTSCGKRHTGGY